MKYLKPDGTSEDIPQDNPAPHPVKLRRTGPDAPTNNTFEINISLEYTEIAPGIVVKAIDLLENPAGFRKHYKGKAIEWERFLWSVGKIFYNRLREDLQDAVDKLEKKLFKKKDSYYLKSRALNTQQTRNYSTQLEILYSASDETKKEIEADTKEKNPPKIYGPALKTGEHLVLECLQKLLHKKSEIYDSTSEKYYAGNYFPNKDGKEELVKIDVPIKSSYAISQISPAIQFTLYELAKEYTGLRAPSGKDQQEVNKILLALANRKYLFVYTEKLPDRKKGENRREVVEHYAELLEFLTRKEIGFETIIKEDIVLRLHPIFRTNIATENIQTPDDMVSRVRIAAGGREVDHSTLQLKDYLLQEHSHKRYNPKIGLHKLYSIVAEADRLRKNYPRCRKKLLQGIEVCKNLGIVEGWKEDIGATGEPVITFALWREWI
jgi:hypothetical protein